jgi:16S rRNA (cytidine1402-2'-O)-methyltransferase
VTGVLTLVATPIGNLGDLSPRAIEALRSADVVCCEDTRRTGLLLQHAGIAKKRLMRCDEHTEFGLIPAVMRLLAEGQRVAVVSDAGTPGISDPGERLVAAAVEAGFAVSAIPGPAALIAALVVSGLPAARFAFEGFLPRKAGERAKHLQSLSGEQRTMVFYEAPHRLTATLNALAKAFGSDRRAALVREFTKMHEEVVRGPIGELALHEPRGEYVIVVAGAPAVAAELTDDDLARAIADALATGLSRRDAAAAVAARLGIPKNVAYAAAVNAARK